MKKTPKNLKKAVTKKESSKTSFDVLFDPNYEPYMASDYKAEMKTPKARMHTALHELAISLCREVNLGYDHASTMYDNRYSNEQAVGKFLSLKSYETSELASGSINIENVEFSEVQEKFNENLKSGLPESNLKDLTGFNESYQAAKELGFTGSDRDFENDLKNSQSFKDFMRLKVVDYSG